MAPTRRGIAASFGNAEHLGAPLDLAVEALQRVGGVKLGPVLLGEAHVGAHVVLGLVEQGREFGQLGADLVGDLAPLGLGGAGVVLGEAGGDEGSDDALAVAPAWASALRMKCTRQRCQVARNTRATCWSR
jgi:hypothetical protein